MAKRYALRDDQWDRIQDLLPRIKNMPGRPAKDNRLFVDAVLFRFRAGIAWRDLPERFGDWKNVYQRFNRWSDKGVWQKLFECLASQADNEYAMIDSTIVRAHQLSAGKAQKKPGDWTKQGWLDHQDSCNSGCLGQSYWITFNSRTSA
jgi:transposase